MTKDIQHSFSQDKMHIVMRNTDCPNCEYHRQRAQNWREEAYKQAGHDIIERPWVGLTNQERSECWETIPELAMKKVEAKLKEKNDRTL